MGAELPRDAGAGEATGVQPARIRGRNGIRGIISISQASSESGFLAEALLEQRPAWNCGAFSAGQEAFERAGGPAESPDSPRGSPRAPLAPVARPRTPDTFISPGSGAGHGCGPVDALTDGGCRR